MLKKRSPSSFQVFQVDPRIPIQGLVCEQGKDDRLKKVLKNYKSVVRSELPGGFPEKRLVYHAIDPEKGSNPPHGPLYQLFPAEKRAVKKYIEYLLKRGKLRRSK